MLHPHDLPLVAFSHGKTIGPWGIESDTSQRLDMPQSTAREIIQKQLAAGQGNSSHSL